MPTLTHPPLAATDTENLERELLNEFLGAYFTGNPHNDDDGNPATFPLCALAFGQTDVRALDLTPLIQWVVTSRISAESRGEDGMIVRSDCLSTVYVQVQATGRADAADHLCAQTAAQLKALLDSKAPLDLARKGLQRLRVMRGPTSLTMPALRTRLLIVRSHYEFTLPR